MDKSLAIDSKDRSLQQDKEKPNTAVYSSTIKSHYCTMTAFNCLASMISLFHLLYNI